MRASGSVVTRDAVRNRFGALAVVLCAGGLIACSTPYSARTPLGGYTDARTGKKQHVVVFVGNSLTGQEEVRAMALKRAATLCEKEDAPYVAVEDERWSCAEMVSIHMLFGKCEQHSVSLQVTCSRTRKQPLDEEPAPVQQQNPPEPVLPPQETPGGAQPPVY